MKELIKVETNEQGQKLVSGRELHEVLKVQKPFTDWIPVQLKNVDAIENEDYTKVHFKVNLSKTGQTSHDYILTLDIAKEICMCVGVAPRTNEETRKLSKQVRKYFIECEKQLAQVRLDSYMIDNPIERAERWIEEEKERQRLALEVKEKQKELEEKEKELDHKGEVIIGLVDAVTLADKRQRIVKIVKYGAKGQYAKRWGLLYKEFEEKYHVDIARRMTNAKNRGEISKSLNKMDYICDVMGMTSQLYDVCVVVFEADYLACLEDMVHTIKREI